MQPADHRPSSAAGHLQSQDDGPHEGHTASSLGNEMRFMLNLEGRFKGCARLISAEV